MENILNKTTKYCLYALVFLLPLFFLPLTSFLMAQSRQFFLAGFCFLIIILWSLKVFISGKVSFIWNKLSLSVLCLLLVLGISVLFSGSKIQGLWGMSFEPDTFFSFILYAIIFFLFANLVSANHQRKLVLLLFLLSSGILAVLFLINSFVNFLPGAIDSFRSLSFILYRRFHCFAYYFAANSFRDLLASRPSFVGKHSFD